MASHPRSKPPTTFFEAGSPFRALADQVPVMLWISNAQSGPVLFNPDWRHFRGLGADAPVPDGWVHAVHEDDREDALAAFHLSHQEARPYIGEYRVHRADGEVRWVHDHGMPQFDHTGAFIGHMGICVDVTEQRMHDVPGPSEHRLTRLVETSRDMVYRVRLTPAIEVEYVGGAVEAISGHPPARWYSDPMLDPRPYPS
ncbi:MAG: PAS domain-containing protein [Vicinamibacterales bacterium]